MTTKQLKKKIEETLGKWLTAVHPLLVEDLMKRSKEYALSCLPKGKKVKFNTDLGFNQCRKLTKEAIDEK